jgi:hypothetical protein
LVRGFPPHPHVVRLRLGGARVKPFPAAHDSEECKEGKTGKRGKKKRRVKKGKMENREKGESGGGHLRRQPPSSSPFSAISAFCEDGVPCGRSPSSFATASRSPSAVSSFVVVPWCLGGLVLFTLCRCVVVVTFFSPPLSISAAVLA